MPRALSRPPPTSSVARLLDADSVSRALKPVPPPDVAAAPCGAPEQAESSATSIKREFVLTDDTAAILDVMVERLRNGTKTRLSASHAVRSLLWTVRPCLTLLDAVVAGSRPWKLPPNGGLHHVERVVYEQRIADAIATALRRNATPRGESDA